MSKATSFSVALLNEPGAVANVLRLASRLDVDVIDLSPNQERSELVVQVVRDRADAFEAGLREMGVLRSREDVGDTP